MRPIKSLAINAAVALTASLGVGAAHAAACSAITVSPYAGPITPNYVTTDDLKIGVTSSSQCAALYDTNANTKIAGDADELAFTTGVYQQLIGDTHGHAPRTGEVRRGGRHAARRHHLDSDQQWQRLVDLELHAEQSGSA